MLLTLTSTLANYREESLKTERLEIMDWNLVKLILLLPPQGNLNIFANLVSEVRYSDEAKVLNITFNLIQMGYIHQTNQIGVLGYF